MKVQIEFNIGFKKPIKVNVSDSDTSVKEISAYFQRHGISFDWGNPDLIVDMFRQILSEHMAIAIAGSPLTLCGKDINSNLCGIKVTGTVQDGYLTLCSSDNVTLLALYIGYCTARELTMPPPPYDMVAIADEINNCINTPLYDVLGDGPLSHIATVFNAMVCNLVDLDKLIVSINGNTNRMKEKFIDSGKVLAMRPDGKFATCSLSDPHFDLANNGITLDNIVEQSLLFKVNSPIPLNIDDLNSAAYSEYNNCIYGIGHTLELHLPKYKYGTGEITADLIGYLIEQAKGAILEVQISTGYKWYLERKLTETIPPGELEVEPQQSPEIRISEKVDIPKTDKELIWWGVIVFIMGVLVGAIIG